MRKKARGQQGSWFAEVEGERYPCVQERFLSGLNYFDPAEGVPLPDDYVQAIKNGTVILTRSTQTSSGGYQRSGYVALYRIASFAFEDGQMSFNLAERLEDLR